MTSCPKTLLTSVRVVSSSGASAMTLTVSSTPAGRILTSTGTVWPTWTVIFDSGAAWNPDSVAATSYRPGGRAAAR